MKKKNTLELISNLFGDPEIYTFENRTFNAIMLLVSFTGATTLLYDSILSSHVVQLIDFFCFAYPLGCYLYSRKTKKYEALIKISFACFYIALSVAWFFNNGIHGSLPYFYFLLVIYCVILFKKPFKFPIPFVVITVLSMTVSEFYYPEYLFNYGSKIQDYIDVGISLPLCLSITGLTVYLIFNEYIKERISNKEFLKQLTIDKEVMESSFNEIRILRGFLPICANCKKIKDSNGNWKQIEEYIHKHSEAKFSHGICPECTRNLYPEFADRIFKESVISSSILTNRFL